ncbi:hypothetical protein EES45_24765 [Streptomyces sp. ADI97-07]|uniref:hypothetical protein n=1 Tax=Streptomyces sp. ADI97-07 TaxID=1522762 RepID=UPI000F550C06|nr:hypothetical protein [Streptomyces sp. ADI97-07]RPK75703.1 hypothetical protein EES45_24765 [Streptomyces sp. ADI97-07]
MSTGVIAIIIASVSALFTGANMLVSALTYRRTRPRVRLKVKWTLVGPDSTRRALEGNGQFGFEIQLRNLSPTAAKVEGLQLVTRHPEGAPTRWDDFRPNSSKFVDLEHEVPVPPEDAIGGRTKKRDMELPAFGGLHWDVFDDWTTIPSTAWDYLTFQVTLTNGDKLRGEWYHRGRLRRYAEEIQKIFPEKLKGFPMLTAPDPVPADVEVRP